MQNRYKALIATTATAGFAFQFTVMVLVLGYLR